MMNELQNKALALAEKAKSKRLQLDSDEKTEKQRQWQCCKKNAPEIALFLTELNKAFGKPAAIHVKTNDSVILTSGTLARAKNLTVPKYQQLGGK